MQDYRTLVSARQLLDHPEWRVIDCRHDLGDVELGTRQFAQGHLPGAIHAHLDRHLSLRPDGRNGRHPLPRPEAFMAWLGQIGLQPGQQVVAYDDSGGMYAARLWWLLRNVGHEAVAVLDGGLGAWVASGGALTQDVADPRPCHYAGEWRSDRQVDTQSVLDNLDHRTFMLIDARGAGRFAGVGETIDPVGGHIPGARNRPYLDNLVEGRFKTPAQISAEFDQVLGDTPPARVVHQCGSGVTACHNLLAMEYAGLGGSRLYPGSWSEWCSDPARPIAVGPA